MYNERVNSTVLKTSLETKFGECKMKAFTFNVTIAAENLDTEVVVETLRDCTTDALPQGTLAYVKLDGIKNYSEQGYKVFRSRVFGISAKQAGDAHVSKVLLKETVGS